eukprot:TRINITY_DN10153_c0_g1_i13.p6 TRINITY_DN10153_c0_g1~~TRINITY_DN10153_c0_g1_i13.p6  ORF type:complete len:105 (+),score=23.49 TRINITY_DN10153_c0_g1_i13:39-353(+)
MYEQWPDFGCEGIKVQRAHQPTSQCQGFPYLFLEDLPFPEGFLVMYLSSVALFALLYMFGVLLRRMVEARAVVVQVKRPSHRGILFLDVSGAALAAVLAIYIFT